MNSRGWKGKDKGTLKYMMEWRILRKSSLWVKIKNEAEYGNEDDQEEYEIEYDVFFSSVAIQKTLIQQDQNLFLSILKRTKKIKRTSLVPSRLVQRRQK